MRIGFCVTSHGLGHLTRTLAIARAVHDLDARIEICFAIENEHARVATELGFPVRVRCATYEPGVLQKSCFEVDTEATREAYRAWRARHGSWLEAEIKAQRHMACDAIVSDIAALPVRAASELDTPAYGIANFTWDWILEPLLDAEEGAACIELLRSDYARGVHHWVLPFGPESSPFPSCEPAPIVSRLATLDASETRTRLAIPPAEDEKLVVVCPGGWDASDWGAIHAAGLDGFRLLTVGDLPVTSDAPVVRLPHALPAGLEFPDLVAAADVVLTKPGYGIASECATHGTPTVMVERPLFRETPVLLDACRRLGPVQTLSMDAFFAGRWLDALVAAAKPRRWPVQRRDGAKAIATALLDRIHADLGRKRTGAVNE